MWSKFSDDRVSDAQVEGPVQVLEEELAVEHRVVVPLLKPLVNDAAVNIEGPCLVELLAAEA